MKAPPYSTAKVDVLRVPDGATDDVGYQAVEHRHYYSDLHATILHQLGLDYSKMSHEAFGRTFRLVEEGGGSALYRVSAKDGKPVKDTHGEIGTLGSLSVSRDNKTLAYTKAALNHPAEVRSA